MNKSEFELDLEIDPTQLDVEAGLQGELFFKWAEKSVKARKKMDQTKFQLEVLIATSGNRARMDPDSFGIQKVTEGSIDTAVKMSPEYKEAYEEWLNAKSNSALYDRAVEAMEQRKRMLEVLITLHGQQYFAGPSVPRNLAEAWKEKKKTRSNSIRKKTKLRRRKPKEEKDGH